MPITSWTQYLRDKYTLDRVDQNIIWELSTNSEVNMFRSFRRLCNSMGINKGVLYRAWKANKPYGNYIITKHNLGVLPEKVRTNILAKFNTVSADWNDISFKLKKLTGYNTIVPPGVPIETVLDTLETVSQGTSPEIEIIPHSTSAIHSDFFNALDASINRYRVEANTVSSDETV